MQILGRSLTRRQRSALRGADNLSNCVNYRLRLIKMDDVGRMRHHDELALLRLHRDAAQQLRPDLEVDTHGLTPVALAKEVCISLEGCMPSNSL